MQLQVRLRCEKREEIADVLVDTDAQVSLVGKGLFSEEFLQPSGRLVRLKIANRKRMSRVTHEATIGMELSEHDRLKRLDLSKQIVLSGNFYADISNWDIIMRYDFKVNNAIEALPHRATLV